MFNLDYQSGLPIYEQIVEQFERYIAFGVLKPKEQIPSIRELASSLGINPNTVKKAYEELEKRGAITTISTKGTFVTDKINMVIDKKVKDFYDFKVDSFKFVDYKYNDKKYKIEVAI